MTHEWEKPVKSILDRYGLDDLTIVGALLGGMLAPRAAAFEAGIKRVVAWEAMPDFLEVIISTCPRVLQTLMKAALRLKSKLPSNLAAKREMAADTMAEWGIKHGMCAFGAGSPHEYLTMADRYQMLDIARLITQDFLLLGSTRDHFIPRGFYEQVIDSMVNVKSPNCRLFTAREEAENRCKAGNTRLVLDVIMDRIAGVSR